MARRYPPIVTFTPAIARTATSASVPGSIPDARVCRTIAEAGMVPVRIDPTRPDPPHRLNRTDRSIDIDRYRSTRSMLGFNACTIRASASPIEWNRCTDTHRSIAPISIGTHRYASVDRSIATATAGTRGARLTWRGWNVRILDVDLNRAREDDAWPNARAVDADARTRG